MLTGSAGRLSPRLTSPLSASPYRRHQQVTANNSSNRTGAVGRVGANDSARRASPAEAPVRSRASDRVSLSPEAQAIAAGAAAGVGRVEPVAPVMRRSDQAIKLIGSDHGEAVDVVSAGGQGHQDIQAPVAGADSADQAGHEPSHQGGENSGKNDRRSPEQKLTEAEKEEVDELRARDAEVRRHEQAHKTAAGSMAPGAPVYDMQTGPDNRSYAVGGHVNIRIPSGDSPEEAIKNAEQARRAALAPAEPSDKDRAVAAEAAQMAARAHAELAAERQKETQESGKGGSPVEDVGEEPADSTPSASEKSQNGAADEAPDKSESERAGGQALVAAKGSQPVSAKLEHAGEGVDAAMRARGLSRYSQNQRFA